MFWTVQASASHSSSNAATADVLGKSSQSLYPDEVSFRTLGEAAYPHMSKGLPYKAEIMMRRLDGQLFWTHLIGKLVTPSDTDAGSIWIVDDITALRHLSPDLLAKDAAFVAARPAQQRIEAHGGWPNGAAAFVGENPAGGAVITYYQRTRHLFGKLKIEVLDSSGTDRKSTRLNSSHT